MTAGPNVPGIKPSSWWGENWKALLAVWGICLLPFLPVLFAGDILVSSDQMGAPGSWRWYFDALRGGEIPLWNPYRLGGMPTFDAMFGDSAYPVFLLLGFVLPVTHIVTYNFLLHILIAGFSAYVLARRGFGVATWIAVALAVAYALNPHFIGYVYGGHTGKFHILSWLPLSVFFLLRVLGPAASWKHVLGLSATIALFASANHPQFTYYVLMGYFLIWLYFLLPPLRRLRFREMGSLAVRFWVPILLGLGMLFAVLYPPLEYNSAFSVRGGEERTTYEHAISWSIHPEEAASLFVPEFGGLNRDYWGRNPFKINTEAPGTLVWFLALLGVFAFRRSRWFWLWSSIGVLAIIFGLGGNTPLYRLFYEFIPGIKNFRAPSMMLFWLVTALLLMSAETVRRLLAEGRDALPQADRDKIFRRLRITGYSVAGGLAFFAIFPGVAYAIWGVFVDEARIANIARQGMAEAAFTVGAFRVAALVAVLTWATTSFLLRARRPLAFGLVALAVAVADTYWVNRNFIQGYPPGHGFASEPAIDHIKSDPDRFRVFGLPGAYERDFGGYHGFEAVDGWVDNEVAHYRQFRGNDYQRNPNFFIGLEQNQDGTVSGNVFLDLLNVKYLAFRPSNDQGLRLALNASHLPRAWFTPHWEAVDAPDALRRLKESGFDPRRTTLVTAPGAVTGGDRDADVSGVRVQETLRKYNRLAYMVETPVEGVFVLSEVWFPHWNVKVNGRSVELLRANHALRGVHLQPGTHEVTFVYRSPWIRTGLIVAFVSALGLALLCFGFAAAERRRAVPRA